jgi:4-alpha-glucanotransferase
VRPPSLDPLYATASQLGMETGYWDVRGGWHDASGDAVLAVLEAMGAPVDAIQAGRSLSSLDAAVAELTQHAHRRATEPVAPVVTLLDEATPAFRLCWPDSAPSRRGRIQLDLDPLGEAEHHAPARTSTELVLDEAAVVDRFEADGQIWRRYAVPLPFGLPVGYHELTVELDDRPFCSTVLRAPAHVDQPGPTARLWGALVPLYALREGRGLGPNLGDLDVLADWLDGFGGKIVGTLPLLAAYLDGPFEPSPYSPVSRCFWNELYLDLDRLTEGTAGTAPPSGPRFDAAAQHAAVTEVLDRLTTSFFGAGDEVARRDFDRWNAAHPRVTEYGRFRAVAHRQGTGWSGWPKRLRDGSIEPSDYDVAVAARHVYAQWAMDRQMGDLSHRLSGRGQHLYLDLPVGAAADGFDTWIDRDAYAWGAAVGAPPDDFFALGQNWGFPPLRPDMGRAEGHRHLADALGHHMAYAGMLRLDHVMGLHRLFWVPDGMEAQEGVYVRYPTDEQFAVVAIESHRSGCVVVGEDLGTVPDEVREAMDRHRVLRSYVAEFAMGRDDRPVGPDGRSVASVDTHDTPTFATWAAGLDPGARDRMAEQMGTTDLLAGVLGLLARSDAPAVLVTLEDLVGQTEPQNMPGTGPERPNWVVRLPGPLGELGTRPEVSERLAAVQDQRLASHAQAEGEPTG